MSDKDKELSFDELLDSQQDSVKQVRLEPGEEYRTKVVLISNDALFLDYGGKSEGWASLVEFKDENGECSLAIDDYLDVKFLGWDSSGAHFGKEFRVSSGDNAMKMLRDAYEGSIPITGTIKKVNKGGFDVEFSGVRAFCPMSQIDIAYCEDPYVFIGRTEAFKVIEIKDRKRIVVSRREIMKEEREALKEQTLESLEEGAEFDGIVVRIQPFGAFVDIGGVDGMVHVSQISRKPVDQPSDVLKVGQEVRVKVLEVGQDDKGNERISLSMKALEPDPWEDGLGFEEGDKIKGTIRRLETFGAFVTVAPGVDGLVHISEIDYERVAHPSDRLKKGEDCEVLVLGVDYERKRISLSIKQTKEPPAPETPAEKEEGSVRSGDVIRRKSSRKTVKSAEAEQSGAGEDSISEDAAWEQTEQAAAKAVKIQYTEPRIGLMTSGIVRDSKPYGVFVDLPKCGPKASGLMHISEFSDDVKGGYKEGESIEVEIIRIDERGRLSLSQKSAEVRREREQMSSFMNKQKKSFTMGSLGDLFSKVKLDDKK